MPFPSCVPRLSDALVALRAHDARDVERIVEMCTDPESQRWTTVPAPYATADAHQFLAAVAQEWSKPDDLRYWAISAANRPRHCSAPSTCAREVAASPKLASCCIPKPGAGA